MSSTNQLPDSAGFKLHARLIGAIPKHEEDLFVSVALGFLFWALCGVGIWRWLSKTKTGEVLERYYNTSVLMGVSVSCFFLGLGFWLRAGISNSEEADRRRSTYQAEQILFVLASLIWVDVPALTITRDEVLMEQAEALGVAKERPFRAPHHWMPKWVWFGRSLLVLASILYVAGIVMLPRPADSQPAFGKTTSLRLAGSFLVFLIMLVNLMFLAHAPIKFKSHIETRLETRKYRLLVLFCNLLVLETTFYNFVIVAVTDDNNPMIKSKVFFYFAYGFFPALMVVTLIAINLRKWTGSGEIPWWQL